MRSEDASFAALLLVEGLDENTVRTALWRLRSAAPEIDVEAMEAQPIYRMCFSLQRR
jgi:DNA-binding transcriptional regulator PaaX